MLSRLDRTGRAEFLDLARDPRLPGRMDRYFMLGMFRYAAQYLEQVDDGQAVDADDELHADRVRAVLHAWHHPVDVSDVDPAMLDSIRRQALFRPGQPRGRGF